MLNLKSYHFMENPEVKTETSDNIKYIVDGEPLVDREYVLDGEVSVETEEYVVLTYKASDIRRNPQVKQGILVGVKDDKETPLITINYMILDGHEHRVIVKCESVHYDFLRLKLSSRKPHMELEIIDLYTCSHEELPGKFETGDYKDGYACIAIDEYCNCEIPNTIGETDGGKDVPKGKVGINGIPFEFSKEGKMVRPSPSPESNNDIIKNITTYAKRVDCRPESRQSIFSIDVNDSAKEIYFALLTDGKTQEKFASCPPETGIIGSTRGEVRMPIKINDVERFVVRICYEDGFVDECFPENILTHKHEIIGEVGIYGLVALDKKIKQISFENRIVDTDVSLLALTLNKDAYPILGEMFPQRKKKAEKQFDLNKEFTLKDDILTVQNGGFYMEINTNGGMFVQKTKSAYSNSLQMHGALLKVRDGEEIITEFQRTSIVIDKGAQITYSYKSLSITVYLELSEKDSISMRMTAKNNSEDNVQVGIIFPCLNNVQYQSGSDTWYFLPKYRNTESNASCYVYEESSPTFPMQFMDIFSPGDGAGLSINTQERDLKVRKYALSKANGFVHAFVEYPSDYCKILPLGVFNGSPTIVAVHSGDWHAPFESYKNWVDSWYEPYRCQNKKWYRERFWLLAEITDCFETKDIYKMPVWYDEKTMQYNFNMIMDNISELYGETPDIMHMWGWAWIEERDHQLWGNFGEYDYNKLGGLENFRNALEDVRQKTGAEISLYLHPTLLTEIYPQSKEYYPKYRVVNSEGNHICTENDSYRMCHGNKVWRDYALEMYKRVYAETGVKILYIDEFSLRIHNRCYAEEHGHEVPSNLLKTDRNFITELKDSMPDDVVLYGEYYAADVNARYIDANISYYILDLLCDHIEQTQGVYTEDASDCYGTVLTDVYRFVFPKIVQIILPISLRHKSWHPLKATFFNGEAIYDSFWDAEERRGREFIAKAYRIKKQYADCFSSDNPQTMIDSMNDAVCINRFPSENRCIYTLYNRSYHTYSGEILVVPYKENVTYYDVWNDCPAETYVKDGYTYIKAEVTAQGIGAIAEIEM